MGGLVEFAGAWGGRFEAEFGEVGVFSDGNHLAHGSTFAIARVRQGFSDNSSTGSDISQRRLRLAMNGIEHYATDSSLEALPHIRFPLDV